MSKPVITLKNLKTMPSLSEETTAYTATVYVDGVKFAEASNRGHGEEDRIRPFAGGYDALTALEERIKATYPPFDLASPGEEPNLIPMDLSLLIGEEITKDVWVKDYRRTIKTKVLYLKPGEKAVYQMKIVTGRALADHFAFLRGKTPDAVILNEKPEAEAVALYKANVAQR